MLSVAMLNVVYADCHLSWVSHNPLLLSVLMLSVLNADCHLCIKYKPLMLSVVMLSDIMLTVTYAECCCAELHYADCHLC